jgi:hypothetical protein
MQKAVGAVGEMTGLSKLRTVQRFMVNGPFTPYMLDSSVVNYDLARSLYQNTDDKYKLGAAFARPIINATAGFMGAPGFKHPDDEASQALEAFFKFRLGKLLRINRNTLRDGDVYVRLWMQTDRFTGQDVFELGLIPPEWVVPIRNPLTGALAQVIIRHPVLHTDANGLQQYQYTVTETITEQNRTIEVDSRAPKEVRDAMNGTTKNPWGFVPVVHFKNESEEYQANGSSDLEPVEPFLKAYHDVMYHGVEGSRLFSRPKATFSLDNVGKFLTDNFSAAEIKSGKLNFAGKELFMLNKGDTAGFITGDTGWAGVTTLLEFLYYCIVDVSETPEFVFGTAVASSKASVSEQMVPLARKIRRKRGQMEEPFGELASMYLAMQYRKNNRRLDTFQVETEWEELNPRDDAQVATTVKNLIDGLTMGMESGLVSAPAAAEFLREFVPTMLPFSDPDAPEDEKRRIAETVVYLERIKNGLGQVEQGSQGQQRPGKQQQAKVDALDDEEDTTGGGLEATA